MEVEKMRRLELLASEGFIKRAATVEGNMMLKGSYVTRQYFPNPADRYPADMDWVYTEHLKNDKRAREAFDAWAIAVTEVTMDDGITFRSFAENAFWRSIDYAMHDDFPTVNTDLDCVVEGVEIVLSLDISFNLDIPYSPIPLMYRPVGGEAFNIPYTVPLALQVSWKIHQTLVRPRFKDLFDLMYLVQHESFDEETLERSFTALIAECDKDQISHDQIQLFLEYEFSHFFGGVQTMEAAWKYWRHGAYQKDFTMMLDYYDRSKNVLSAELLPKKLPVFLAQLSAELLKAGINKELAGKLSISPPKENKSSWWSSFFGKG